MLDQNDTKFYNVKGIQINDPSINHDDTLIYGSSCTHSCEMFPTDRLSAPAVGMFNEFANIFNLNDSFVAEIRNASEACGYDAFMEAALQFPPTGPIPTAPSSNRDGCSIWDDIVLAGMTHSCFEFRMLDIDINLSSTLREPLLQLLPCEYHTMLLLESFLIGCKILDYCPFLWDELGKHN